jgi:hypothetical protein
MITLVWIGSFGREHSKLLPIKDAEEILAILSQHNIAAWLARP